MTPMMQLAAQLVGVAALSGVFAKVEIHIEGTAGWAANLPTWRIEKHWLLDVFFGGRPLTGYHAWMLAFMVLVFHFPFLLDYTWSRRHEARVAAGLIEFWIVEDFLWFVLNPAFGIRRFTKAHVPWHKHWFLWAPTDYYTFAAAMAFLLWYAFS
jgi:hypothetical protein